MGETIPFNAKDGDANTPNDDRIYSNEEVSEIIGVALRNAQAGDGTTVNHAEMLSIAGEFGLGGADIQRALDDLAEKQVEREMADQVEVAFKLHVATFVVINAGLFLINLLSDPSYWWFLYPVVCWGSVVVLHGIAVKYVPTAPWLMLEPMIREHFNNRGIWPAQTEGSSRVAFYIDELYGSLAKANGIAEVTDEALILEFEIVDTIFGAIKSKVREEIVPFEDIAAVRVQRGMWNSKLHLQGRRLSTFADVPMAKGGEVSLSFRRENRNSAEYLAREISEHCGR